MIRRPPRSTRTDTLFPYTTLFRSAGHRLRKARSRALAALGIVFQAQTLDLDLTVTQNLRYFAALRGLPGRAALAAAQVAHLRGRLVDRKSTRLNYSH